MEKVKLEGEDLDRLRESFRDKQLAAAEAKVADAAFLKQMTVVLVKHRRNVDADRVCLDCGLVTRSGACECKPD